MAAAIGSCFSVAAIRSKQLDSGAFGVATSPRSLPVATSVSYNLSIDSLSIGILPSKWRPSRISAAVAQEEAAATLETEAAEEQEEQEEQEEKVAEEESVQAEAEGGTVSTKLYFGNLPYNCDSSQLAGIIQEYGSPEMIEVLYDRDTGRSRGFAFVTMSSIEDCHAVIEKLDGSEYGGRMLRVNFSDKPKPKVPLYPETEYKLFVGNLSWSVTSEALSEAFQQYGNVVGARVLFDGDTGRSRGYGFVCYSSQEEMDAAIENLNGVVCPS
ncbi:hypothetical protein ACLOJK_011229 [Asimina triloba]